MPARPQPERPARLLPPRHEETAVEHADAVQVLDRLEGGVFLGVVLAQPLALDLMRQHDFLRRGAEQHLVQLQIAPEVPVASRTSRLHLQSWGLATPFELSRARGANLSSTFREGGSMRRSTAAGSATVFDAAIGVPCD